MERREWSASWCTVWALILCSLAASPGRGLAEKSLSAKEARRLISRVAGSQLKTGAVRIVSISPAVGGTVEVAAEVETAFRFTKDEDGRWRAVAVRTGDRTWEEIDFLADAVSAGEVDRARSLLEELVTQFEGQQRETREVPEVRRGALRIKEFSPLLSSAVAVAEIAISFRLTRDGRGKWQVAAIAPGGGRWVEVDSLVRAVNGAKSARARAELETLATALEAFRRVRGFYVISTEHAVLVDHLSPRYAPRVIRIDPWHRPYEYEGTRDRFRLRSIGADGMAGTPDDIAITSRN